MAATLKFRRLEAGVYVAQDITKHYTVWRDGSWWSLAVKELVTTAGVRHAVGQNPIVRNMHETKALCVAIARIYSSFGDNYRESEHGHRSRMTEAIGRAHAVNARPNVQCTYEREGPRVGYRVVAWRARCKRKVAVTDGQLARCWQHGGATKK